MGNARAEEGRNGQQNYSKYTLKSLNFVPNFHNYHSFPKKFWVAELVMLNGHFGHNGKGDIGPTTETLKLQTCILNCQIIDKVVL